MKKIVFTVLAVFGASLFMGIEASACSCSPPFPPRSLKKQVDQARRMSRAVFAGEVVAILKQPQDFQIAVKISVTNRWKGDVPEVVTIQTGIGDGDCGYRFEVGERYIVYAYGTNESDLSTNICQRTKNFLQADDDLKVLGKPKDLKKNKS